MTREEAITVLKAFMENPLFSEIHKAAFNIAIHDIKAYQDWNINKLMLVPKTEWEQEPILDKIRAEIHATAEMHEDGDYYLRDEWIDEIIDKYKAESEDKE